MKGDEKCIFTHIYFFLWCNFLKLSLAQKEKKRVNVILKEKKMQCNPEFRKKGKKKKSNESEQNPRIMKI